ncbi:MAG TPA: type II toxin-antitoxin system ParD family antitoxin [Pirellulales bacterium]|nr:type II toxin-antitoxin system ParD family antitoxin [Pirellulales bacterium]
MSIELSPDLEEFVQKRVTSGDYGSEVEVIRKAFGLLEEREQLLREIDVGIRQLDAGESTEYDAQSLDRFIADIREEADRLRSTHHAL